MKLQKNYWSILLKFYEVKDSLFVINFIVNK